MRHNLLIVEAIEGNGEYPNAALLRCNVDGELTGDEVKDRIDKAVTDWRLNTAQGRAWFEDCGEFDVMSLQHALANHSSLMQRLRDRGITTVDLAVVSAVDVNHSWTFNDRLGEHPAVETRKCDLCEQEAVAVVGLAPMCRDHLDDFEEWLKDKHGDKA